MVNRINQSTIQTEDITKYTIIEEIIWTLNTVRKPDATS